MCKSDLHSFLTTLPKVEHHMHLEGAITPTLFFELCKKNSIDLPRDPAYSSVESLEARYSTFTSLDDFLHYYYIGMSALRTPSDFESLGMAYFAIAHAQGVQHAELFFDPQAHTTRGVPYDSIVEGFVRACQKAQQLYHISSLLIPCFLRHMSVSSAHEAYKDLRPDLQAGKLAGVGLDSSERGFPPELFKDVFAAAAQDGVRRTAHAGEERGPDGVREALEFLKVQRIDHGRTIHEDDILLKEVANANMLVTLCPLSNVCLKGVASVKELPIPKFLKEGLRFSINSDDPAYFGGYILENYCAVQEAFGLTKEQWIGIVLGSIEGSWCGEERKDELRRMVEASR